MRTDLERTAIETKRMRRANAAGANSTQVKQPMPLLTQREKKLEKEASLFSTSMQTMKGLIKEDLAINGLSLWQDIPQPKPAHDEIKIKVLAAAVCGTDKSIYHSGLSEGIRKEMHRYLGSANDYRPIVIGHEFCGIVEELGAGIEHDRSRNIPKHLMLERGDYVTAEMHLSCGHCRLCRTGNEHICTQVKVKGVHLDGCFSDAVVVPYKNVIMLGKGGDRKEIPLRLGAMLDAFGNAVHTVDAADVKGKSVAILGAGPLGLMSTLLCRHFGATRIYITEVIEIERRFSLASKFGADECHDVSRGSEQFYKCVEKHEIGANGVDVVLEMSGALSAYNDAFRVIRNGGTVVLLGIPKKPLDGFDIANGVIWKGVTAKGIFGRKMFDTWELMLRLLRNDHSDMRGKLDSILSAKTYTLEEYVEAFEALARGDEMKLVFSPDSASGLI